ncbi:uncharacterized protein CXorf65 homolog [Nematostella vectensis]|uniref:uncharacterized protein CXorf65 homolog n=1 Tax=Nematostella vectensis TaxID=45351 RepID=UPI0013903EF9|nr:uncharacterized protein CXorf65 homolog [Nematostella vectensis]
MFITVRYGDGEESLFNPHCRINSLLEDIRKRCKCTKDAHVDLSDERGNLKYLVEHPTSYASDLLKERESFVLIRIEKKPEDEGDMYTPLLNDIDVITESFLERLSKCESETASSKSTKAAVVTNNNKKQSLVNKARNAFMSSPTRGTRSRERTSKSPNAVTKKLSR